MAHFKLENYKQMSEQPQPRSFVPLAEFLADLSKTHPKPRQVDQRFLDEINKYGRIVSVEEFLKAAKEDINERS